jgi:ornithine carrier protein
MHDLTHRSSPVLSHKPPGIFSVISSIAYTHGISGFWLGHTGTMLRETGGSAAWFVVKEWVGNILRDRRLQTQPNFVVFTDDPGGGRMMDSADRKGSSDMTLLPWESAVAGAVAGAVGALVLYPADTVKSAIQTEEELRSHTRHFPGRAAPASTFWNTFGKMYRNYGLKGLYAGCGMTIARAVPSSGIIFVVYDGLSAWIG